MRQLRGRALDFILELGSGNVITLGNVLDDGGKVDAGLGKPLDRKLYFSRKYSIGNLYLV